MLLSKSYPFAEHKEVIFEIDIAGNSFLRCEFLHRYISKILLTDFRRANYLKLALPE